MPYRLAFAGLYFHVQCLLDRADERLRLVAIADRAYPPESPFHNPGMNPVDVAAARGVPLYSEIDDLLDRERPDILAVYAVDRQKADIIIRALQRGIHVVADKPPCITREQLDAIATALSTSSGSLAILFPFPFAAILRRMRDIVHSGVLGDVVMVRSRRAYLQKVATRPKWFFTKEYGGGILCDIGTHDLDLVRFVTGQDAASVSAQAGNARIPDYPTGEDHANALFTLTGGATYAVQVDRIAVPTVAGDQSSLTIFGTRGQAMIPAGFEQIEITVEDEAGTMIESGFSATEYTPLIDDYLASLDAGSYASHYFAPQVFNSVRGMLCAQYSADNRGIRVDV